MDFVVIGGVIGAYGAKFLAKNNDVSDVILIEEHKPDDQPVHCAGLISKSGFERINISPSKFILNKVKGAKFFSQNNTFELRTNETKAYVVDRKAFDNYLLNSAIDCGAKFINKRVIDIEAEKDFMVKTKDTHIKTKNIVLATGSNYVLHRKLKKFGLRIPKFLTALQYEIFVECEQDMVELHLTNEFFVWIIPVNGYARVGIAGYRNICENLDNFIKRLKSNRKVGEILTKQAGLIPLYESKLKTECKFGHLNLRLVGDAAAHVKATTGGGMVMGCIAAQHLAKKDYERSWRKGIGNELYMHSLIRRFLNKNYEKYDDMLTFANNHKKIFYSSDMDFASKFFRNSAIEFIRHPLMLAEVFKILF